VLETEHTLKFAENARITVGEQVRAQYRVHAGGGGGVVWGAEWAGE
jgi:hypothetical protein